MPTELISKLRGTLDETEIENVDEKVKGGGDKLNIIEIWEGKGDKLKGIQIGESDDGETVKRVEVREGDDGETVNMVEVREGEDSETRGIDDTFAKIDGEESDTDLSESGESYDEIDDVKEEIEGSFKLGQTFASAKEARKAINLYGIQHGYKLHFVKNEKTRLRVVCVNEKSCIFLFYCSKIGDDGGMTVKTLIEEHNCYKQMEVPSMTQGFLENYFKERVYKDPKFSSKQMQKEVESYFTLHVTLFKCKKTRKILMIELNDSIVNEFKILGAYIDIAKEANPGSKCELQLSNEGEEAGRRVFRRLFVFRCLQKELDRGV